MGDDRWPMADGRRAMGDDDMQRIEKRLLILWVALAFVVWNGVYDMRMHDTVRGYLIEATRAPAGVERSADMRTVPHRGQVDAVAFSFAWSPGVFPPGLVTMGPYRPHLPPTRP